MRLSRTENLARALAIVAFVGLGAVGCSGAQSESNLVKGESYTSGEDKFDAFFAAVTAMRTRTPEGGGSADLLRETAVAVSLPETSGLDETLAAVKNKAEEHKKDGARIYAVVASPTVQLIAKNGKKDAQGFADSLEAILEKGLVRANELETLEKEIAELEKAIAPLEEEAPTSFVDPKVRNQVMIELDGAKRVLEIARLRAGVESGRALRFVMVLAGAVDDGAAAKLIAAGPVAPEPPPAKPRPGGGKPAYTGGGKPAKPAKPKGEDFDP